MKIKISQRDARLLMFLFALLILAGTYFFVYMDKQEQTNQLMEDNKALEERVSQLNDMVSKREEVETDIREKQEEMKQVLDRFPSLLTTEKVISILEDLENQTGMEVKSIEFNMEKPLGGEKTEDGEMERREAYVSTITFAYGASYDELKQVIDYVNDYPDKMAISQFTSIFNKETGELDGNMKILMYSAEGTEKEYRPPVISGADGKENNLFQ